MKEDTPRALNKKRFAGVFFYEIIQSGVKIKGSFNGANPCVKLFSE